MSDIKQVKIDDDTYDIKDEVAQQAIENLIDDLLITTTEFENL